MQGRHLVIGLGNPGKTYEDTRHNIGFRVVKALAAKCGITLKSALMGVKGITGEGVIREYKTRLLMPMTYMNGSGLSVSRCCRRYAVAPSHLIVVTDDVALSFGCLRLRSKGSSGGHNGLKSVQAHLGTPEYPRLRIGVGDSRSGELVDHVLGRFAREEQQMLPELVDRAIWAIELWISEGIDTAMQEVNRSN